MSCLLNPHRMGVIGGGIAGHGVVYRVESSATLATYNFTLPGITAGQLIHLPIKIITNSNITDPTLWAVTLNGVAATRTQHRAHSNSGVFPAIGTFRVVANATGDLALSITLDVTARACGVDARYLSGVHATTPVVGAPTTPSNLTSDVATLNSPNGYVPQAVGNVILTDIVIKGGDITSLAATSGAGGAYYDETGIDPVSDVESGAAYNVAPNTSPISIVWDWAGADRVVSTNIEYQAA